MKVKELIEQLSKVNPEAQVFMGYDSNVVVTKACCVEEMKSEEYIGQCWWSVKVGGCRDIGGLRDMTKSELRQRLDVLVKAIYETPQGGCGCCLHIVLDDGNFEEEHVRWCLEHAEHGICREVAELLLKLTDEGRETAVGLGVINFLAVKEDQIRS